MPLYEYRCDQCGNIDEVLQKIADSAPDKCSKCGGSPMEKIMSKSAFVLKGQGWYVTDFRDNKTKNSTASDNDSSGSSDSSSSDATDSSKGDSGTKKNADSSGDNTSKGSSSSSPAGKSEKTTSGHSKGTSAT